MIIKIKRVKKDRIIPTMTDLIMLLVNEYTIINKIRKGTLKKITAGRPL